MLIVAAIILAIAVGILFYARNAASHLRALKDVPTVSCSEVESRASASSLVEVVGTAVPMGEVLTAPLSQQPCVWHRVSVEERYWQDNGSSARTEETRTLSDTSSSQVFGVQDSTGVVAVDANDASVDAARESHDEFERTGSNVSITIQNVTLGSQTIGVRTREWILEPGEELFVSGQASVGNQGPRLEKPAKGRLVVSTRSEEELTVSAQRKISLSYALSGVAALIAIALFVISF